MKDKNLFEKMRKSDLIAQEEIMQMNCVKKKARRKIELQMMKSMNNIWLKLFLAISLNAT